jgi:uncharacterized membrane protein YfcA
MPEIGSLQIAVFLCGTLVAAFVLGLVGFAFGIVAAGIWLHALTPAETTSLIAAYALLVQSHATWKLRRALNVRRLIPFIAGSAVGIPAGILALKWAPAAEIRVAAGWVLLLFSLYNLLTPKLPQVKRAGSLLDGVVGGLSGALGGSTGLGGTLPAIWCGMRGWSKDEQRAVFQPTAVATFLMTALWLGSTGTITLGIVYLFALGLPVLVAGTWLGWKLYGKFDEAMFRKAVNILLILSGSVLVST